MKMRSFSILFLLILGLSPGLAVKAHSSGIPELRQPGAPGLNVQVISTWLSTARDREVLVWIENAPWVYGAQAELVFEAGQIEIVDADPNQAGVQVTGGNFFDPNQAIVIRNSVDSQPNSMDYAISLLNPAPEVSGNGLFLILKLRGKQAGPARLTISGVLGTTSGATIDLPPVTLEFQVVKQSFTYLPAIRR